MKIKFSIAKSSFLYRKYNDGNENWKLKYRLKCQSTENELSQILSKYDLRGNHPIALIADEQTAGFGQKGKLWHSPKGGIWLSAAYPIFSSKFSTDIFPISLASYICQMFLDESVEVNLKWPNDIFYGSKKLIGFLPRVITRGNKILYIRVGIGMNLCNKSPKEGISLNEIIKKKKLDKNYWIAMLLKQIHCAANFNNDGENIIKNANKFLTKKYLPSRFHSEEWNIEEINDKGKLILSSKTDKTIIKYI